MAGKLKEKAKKSFDYESYRSVGWVNRAMTSPMRYGERSSVRSMTISDPPGGQHYVIPTIRVRSGVGKTPEGRMAPGLVQLSAEEARKVAKRKKDAIPFKTLEEAEAFSQGFSKYLGTRGKK